MKIYFKKRVYSKKVLGKGESLSLTVVRKYNDIIASNNLKDIKTICKKIDIKYITTSKILYTLYIRNVLLFNEVEYI